MVIWRSFFWMVRRERVSDIPRAFKLAELFHRDYALGLEKKDDGSGFRRVDMAAQILDFYREYPQIDDEKIEILLEIFRNLREWKGGRNYANYAQIMRLAFLNRDKELAEEAKKEVEKMDGRFNCYVCFYGKPMLQYCVLHEDEEGILEMAAKICERSIPVKYHWCFDKCSQANEEELKSLVLQDCLNTGEGRMFARLWKGWRQVFEEPETGEGRDAKKVLFHSLAGDWSRQEERLRLAEKNDRDRREGRETPLDCLYWSLGWHCYFRMLDAQGIKAVEMRLGEDKERREWACRETAEYFEEQADLLGERMDRARKRFDYARVKRAYEECLVFREQEASVGERDFVGGNCLSGAQSSGNGK